MSEKIVFFFTYRFRTLLDKHPDTGFRLSVRNAGSCITLFVEMMNFVHLYLKNVLKYCFFCTYRFRNLLDKHSDTGVRLSDRDAGSCITRFVEMMHLVHLYLQHGLKNG